MPRVTDYPSLKTHVLQMVERQEDPEAIDILFDGWVSLCEDDFAPVLRAPYLERFSQFTYDVKANGLGFEYLPPSFIECINLVDLTNGCNLQSIGITEVAEYRKPNNSYYGARASAYIIRGYTLTVLPEPDGPLEMELTYYSKSEPLSVERPGNNIIERSPSIYVFGVLKQAALSYGEAQNFQMWGQMMKDEIDKVNDSAVSWRRGPTHAVRVRI